MLSIDWSTYTSPWHPIGQYSARLVTRSVGTHLVLPADWQLPDCWSVAWSILCRSTRESVCRPPDHSSSGLSGEYEQSPGSARTVSHHHHPACVNNYQQAYHPRYALIHSTRHRYSTQTERIHWFPQLEGPQVRLNINAIKTQRIGQILKRDPVKWKGYFQVFLQISRTQLSCSIFL